MMQGQRPPFIPGYGMPIAQRPMRGNRMYSSSAQAHSRMQGFNLRPSMPPYPVVAQVGIIWICFPSFGIQKFCVHACVTDSTTVNC